jgi:hypothetical protein
MSLLALKFLVRQPELVTSMENSDAACRVGLGPTFMRPVRQAS